MNAKANLNVVEEQNEDNRPTDLIASENMAGDLMSCLLDEFKAAPEVWQRMSEQQQKDVLHRLEERVKDNVRAAVNIMAAQGNPTLIAKVEQVVFKDGVKATLQMGSRESAVHDLADQSGGCVVIVVCDPEEYMQGCEDIKPDSDQNSIPGIERDDRAINSFE